MDDDSPVSVRLSSASGRHWLSSFVKDGATYYASKFQRVLLVSPFGRERSEMPWLIRRSAFGAKSFLWRSETRRPGSRVAPCRFFRIIVRERSTSLPFLLCCTLLLSSLHALFSCLPLVFLRPHGPVSASNAASPAMACLSSLFVLSLGCLASAKEFHGTVTSLPLHATVTNVPRALVTPTTSPLPLSDYTYAYTDLVSPFLRERSSEL